MGRGRQKAKQTKVARDLKYYSPPTDLTALERELGTARRDEHDSDGDQWEELAARWNDDEDDDWSDEDESAKS